jgi:hypothetical protein
MVGGVLSDDEDVHRVEVQLSKQTLRAKIGEFLCIEENLNGNYIWVSKMYHYYLQEKT